MNAATSGSSPSRAPRYGLELARLEQEPGAEAAHVAVADLRAVVEPENGANVGRLARLLQQAPSHPQVDQERAARREADDQVLAAPVDVLDALPRQLRGDDERILGPRQPDVADLDVLERASFERRRDRAAHGLDLGKLRHLTDLAGKKAG